MKAWDIFYKNVFQNNFVVAKDKIVLAVSGGTDSVCMLHMFWRLAKKMNIDFLVVNFNHNLRRESLKEANVVRNLSIKLGIKCFLEKIDVKEYSKIHSVSVETAGRELRYLSLEKIANKCRYNKIATAHNANDNAETVLMWLLRGTGNFIGIPQRRELKRNISVIRPLLPIKKKLIEEYVKNHNLQFCVDKSNFLNIYTRNKIRLSLIPIFEKINPMFVEHIFDLTCIQNRENGYLNKISTNCLNKCVKFSGGSKIFLDLTMFLQYNKAIQFRILKSVLPQYKYNSHINFIMHKILSSDKTAFRLSSNWVFKMTSREACFIKKRNL
ncbi:MAG: tRNA lysidine(34) synthetase TilS [Endomicrobium sp.]|jgi:tRNA(Ile)-lysidine synthase|nr:tRNA lysidine(34) synthetase TilS [Endomicrobium sp.]